MVFTQKYSDFYLYMHEYDTDNNFMFYEKFFNRGASVILVSIKLGVFYDSIFCCFTV